MLCLNCLVASKTSNKNTNLHRLENIFIFYCISLLSTKKNENSSRFKSQQAFLLSLLNWEFSFVMGEAQEVQLQVMGKQAFT